jgi:hypothetical protein
MERRPDWNSRDSASAVIARQIRRGIEQRILYFADHPEEIDERLEALDEEWSVERVLQVKASAAVLLGIGLGATRSRAWYLLPVAAAGVLIDQAIRRRTPATYLFRRLGLRTTREIEAERVALKALRGDFRGVGEREDIGGGNRILTAT